MRENPALRLLAFFKSAGRTIGQNSGKDRGREAMALPMMDMSRAKEIAPSLGKLQPLGTEDVRHWLEYWKGVGLLPRSPDATH
ncbi:hypothetical protein PUNSTDRAFT_54805 [Punctularia strigosozonata HHB-11173 SS5]|uniref:uncharacterized protein n=1 Tax=Punctularia strigosozonata (strain HHB-11173) TaxID=741275 RepID=UPI0004416D3C|nr:uncharacterized protein PUNSTDRAFT_54805 [Punctularia strigosozonata HHB-11173 SS5]EIN05389.1 hypothetical protein PUNSTDRAFT_54805 [Punctularia strigosozonata HHB-11173 SS5]